MKKFIEIAREQVSIYGFGADLQHILAVLIGPKAQPAIIGELSAKGIREVADMSINEMMEFGLAEVEAQRRFSIRKTVVYCGSRC